MRLTQNNLSRLTNTYEESASGAVLELYHALQEAAKNQEFERDSFIQEFAATTLYNINPRLSKPLNIRVFEQALHIKLETLEILCN